MRCFIGLPLPEDYQRLLAGIIQEWKTSLGSRVSWTKPGNWHLTLKFLGEIQEERVKPLLEALGEGLSEEKPCPAFALQGHDAGFFPDPRRPRVVWVGLGKGVEQARELAVWVEAICAGLGFAREERTFRPHLTVARIKPPRKDRHGMARRGSRETRHSSASPCVDILRSVGEVSWPEITVDRMVLWESRLSAEGPDYRPLAEWRLMTGATR
ncbi:RNA 2',3'-cyclic phosphodiesterase [Desulfonatronum sp. SC1]|uniref:RNA 2',3'-cyclic phosphodiesterase n=1 Tax=Desulfonatronum sp. SC1 TaxID=2109626 RepID=UPI000D2FB624|nr:RNA 2',3'-cyclic phosphodiesterase [Desulfonatronum sp. SC1]PTN32743.1 RNA 2',3'-cyclic phosphodiesterase [Desulfonatronum sp. SC1]